ncbi:MAG: hypothetical protein HXY40_13520 [Chloroflexi bacterium]|nr:hypothetical protein [Chloroflexota bacterium]
MPDLNFFVELALRFGLIAAGLFIVVGTVLSAIRTFVLPRSANTWLTRQVFGAFSQVFLLRAKKKASYAERDQIMAMFAPTALLALPVVWMICIDVGYTLLYRAAVDDWWEAFRLSGSSLMTLGVAAPPTPLTYMLSYSEAALGLIMVALLIGYLPTMYATFSRRELAVNLLEVRAGSPPSAVEMLVRVHRIHGIDKLHELWTEWEIWFAELEETHTSLAALVFFRSPTPEHSWVTAAGAVLDAAALMTSTLDVPRDAQRELCIRAGYLALRKIADFFRITYNHDPKPTDAISITRDEFEGAYDELRAAGLALKPDRDQCWRDFAGWRVNYDRVLLAIALLTLAPYAPWSSDRGLPDLRPGGVAVRGKTKTEKAAS